MPDPAKLLTTLHRAADAFRATPGRQGRLVALADCDEVLVGGDLHGNLENFRKLLQKADLAAHPRRHLVLQELVHGPSRYPAGGDRSHQLLDLTAALKCEHPNRVHFLLGNHEMAQWTGRQIGKGQGELDMNDLFRQGVETAYGARGAEVYAAYLKLFGVVPLALRTPNRVFISHSLPSIKRLDAFDAAVLMREELREQDLAWGGSAHSIVWGRDTRAETVTAFLQKGDAELLVTGHIPCDEGYAVPNDRQVIVDCTAAKAGYVLFPADRPLTHAELVQGVGLL
jgi:hypothetical protein